jgi:nonspecific dipeptidase
LRHWLFFFFSSSSRNVRGKFSLRLVPGQDPNKIHDQVRAHLETTFKALGSPNKLNLVFHHGGKAWKSDPDHPNYMAGRKVRAYNVHIFPY